MTLDKKTILLETHIDSKKFNYAFSFVLQHEGGYAHHPQDQGGETKYGISKRSYPQLDIPSLTPEDVKKIYFQDFWKPYSYEVIQHDIVAAKIFDFSINMGTARAHCLARKALKKLGLCVPESGLLDLHALENLNSLPPLTFLETLKEEAAHYYKSLVEKNPRQKVFLKGWLNRAYS